MALISFTKPADGETADAADVNTPLTTIYDEFNGNIDTTNMSTATAAKINALSAPDSGWNEVGTSPAFTNSWVNYGSGYNTCAYYKDAVGFVHLKGLVKSGTDGSAIFTLPAGYRPAAKELLSASSNDAYGRIDIATTGTVTPSAGTTSPTWVCLDGLMFKAA